MINLRPTPTQLGVGDWHCFLYLCLTVPFKFGLEKAILSNQLHLFSPAVEGHYHDPRCEWMMGVCNTWSCLNLYF